MNTSGLARQYDKLTAWERLPLVLAALDRGDDAEADRLNGTAPTRPALVPHHYGLWEGLTLLAVTHLGLQLNGAFRLACATALLAAGHVKGDEPLRVLAFEFVVEADAWKLFCAELDLEPDAILRHLPGYDVVRDMEEAARKIAFPPEEALAYLRSQPGAAEPATATDAAREMREFLTKQARPWL
jgi:hypothetical protein